MPKSEELLARALSHLSVKLDCNEN